MDLAHKLGGIPLSETDDFRKALVKFTDANKEEQEELRKTILERFIKGAIKNNLEEEYAVSISENMAKFAGYGFNKSHSMAYSILSYYTLYLKYFFKDEFYTSYLNKRVENLPQVVSEIGVDKFLPVDINLSSKEFKLEGDKIRLGLLAVKNLGMSAIDELLSKQPFSFNNSYKCHEIASPSLSGLFSCNTGRLGRCPSEAPSLRVRRKYQRTSWRILYHQYANQNIREPGRYHLHGHEPF